MALSDDLYREVILDHSQNPRHAGLLKDADAVIEGINPSCGDELRMSIKSSAEKITDIGIEAKGCSISQASASMLAEAIKGKSFEEAEVIIQQIKAMLKGHPHEAIDEEEDFASLEGVKKYPARIKCALLAWTTLQEAIATVKEGAKHTPKSVTTE